MPIALMSDFGLKDAYVGILKGVIESIAPGTPVLDIAHDLPPFDRIHAGALLYQAYRFFPRKTIFVTVVDPGVGSERKPILVETENYFFVGPDNGVFTMVLAEEEVRRIFHLTNPKFFLPELSHTFHGRDIFAPVAAHLARGVDPARMGEEISDWVRLPEFSPGVGKDAIRGQVLSIDRFGNVLTNMGRKLLSERFPKFDFKVTVGEAPPLQKIHTHYAEGKAGEPILLFSSANLLEISVNGGSAADVLQLCPGDKINVIPANAGIHPGGPPPSRG